MTKRKVTDEDLEERGPRATVWRTFMREHKFSEVRIAELLGVSRRTVQMVRAGKVTPHKNTLRRFDALAARYERRKVS